MKARVPHVYTIIFGLIILTALASLVVPGGSYERDADGRVIPGTYGLDTPEESAARPQGWELVFAVWQAPLKGISAAASIIAFILILGGTFRVIEDTGAFETAIRSAIARLGKAESLVVPASMVLFAIGGAVFGMSEEIIPFVLLFVPIVKALGLPPLTAVAVPLVGSQVGFAGAMINPFTVGIAQGIAGLPPLSGWPFRTVLWCVVTAVAVAYVTRHIRRHAASDSEASDSEASDSEVPGTSRNASEEVPGEVPGTSTAHTSTSPEPTVLSGPQRLVLLTLVAGIGVVLWGVGRFAWYVTEIGAVFLATGVVAGIVGRLSAHAISEGFAQGARDLVSAALVVGIARGIVVLAGDLGILDTVLHSSSEALGSLPGVVALELMFLFQTALNFFIPSGSGQAALTMPIMAPLAELVGLTRQMAVLAFQLGDGFSNMIIPTSAVLMGSLEAGKISYERWFRFIWPLQLWLMAVGMVALAVAHGIGFGP